MILTPRNMISEFAARSAEPPSKASPYTRRPMPLRTLCRSKLRTLTEICSIDDTPDLQKPRINASPICSHAEEGWPAARLHMQPLSVPPCVKADCALLHDTCDKLQAGHHGCGRAGLACPAPIKPIRSGRGDRLGLCFGESSLSDSDTGCRKQTCCSWHFRQPRAP